MDSTGLEQVLCQLIAQIVGDAFPAGRARSRQIRPQRFVVFAGNLNGSKPLIRGLLDSAKRSRTAADPLSLPVQSRASRRVGDGESAAATTGFRKQPR